VPLLPVPINVGWLEDLIRQNGQNLYLHRATRCPCVDDNGYVDPHCPVCHGTSYSLGAPEPIRALFTAYDAKKDRYAAGEVATGARQLVVSRRYRLAEGDLVRQRQFSVRDSEVLTYGASYGDRVEALFPQRVLAVSAVRQGALHQFAASEYTDPVTGATFTPGGAVAWQPSATVDPGERYSVEFMRFDAWQVFRGGLPFQRGAQDKRLPDRALAKLVTRRSLTERPVPAARPYEPGPPDDPDGVGGFA
jgi:hypothetical protein